MTNVSPRVYGLSAPFFHFHLLCLSIPSYLIPVFPTQRKRAAGLVWETNTHTRPLLFTCRPVVHILCAVSDSSCLICVRPLAMVLGILDTSATPPQFLPLLCHLKASPGGSLSHGGGTGVQNCLHYIHRSRSCKTHRGFPSPHCFHI